MLHVSMILQGMLLGIGAAAPIGPVNVEIARRTLQGGFRSGFALGCGAVTVDVGYAILVSLSIRPAMSFPILIAIVGVLGAALMCYLGVSSLRHAMANKFTETSTASTVSSTRNYVTGLLLTSLNPMTLAFWFIAVPATVTRMAPAPTGDLPLVCFGVFVAALSWVCLFAGMMSMAGAHSKFRWMKAADLIGGVLLLAFGAVTIWRVARAFL